MRLPWEIFDERFYFAYVNSCIGRHSAQEAQPKRDFRTWCLMWWYVMCWRVSGCVDVLMSFLSQIFAFVFHDDDRVVLMYVLVVTAGRFHSKRRLGMHQTFHDSRSTLTSSQRIFPDMDWDTREKQEIGWGQLGRLNKMKKSCCLQQKLQKTWKWITNPLALSKRGGGGSARTVRWEGSVDVGDIAFGSWKCNAQSVHKFLVSVSTHVPSVCLQRLVWESVYHALTNTRLSRWCPGINMKRLTSSPPPHVFILVFFFFFFFSQPYKHSCTNLVINWTLRHSVHLPPQRVLRPKF